MSRYRFARRSAVALTLLLPVLAWAHGAGGIHLMGFVRGVDATSLHLETKDKKHYTVLLTDKTLYERGEAQASAKDMESGMRVVVHAKKVKNGLEAQLIKLGQRAKPAPGQPEAPSHQHQHDHQH